MKRPYRVAVVGTGWRAGFYTGICMERADLFSLAGVWYHSEKGRKSVEHLGVPLVDTFEGVCALKPDFVVLSLGGGGMKEALM